MIAAREVSVVEAVTAFLDRIQQANGAVGAFVSLRERGDILAEAATLDGRLADGETPGPLFGLPIAVKDLALTKGVRTTFGSRIFADFVPDRDELFVERMRKAGAIIIGKTNVPEFGFGSQSYNAVFGTTRNAHDPRLTAGGSSGGAASALALHMLPIADGSDFCGSLRNPAGWHHIFSLRPSPGRVAAGPAPELFLSQMGVVGPMGRSVSDVALLMSAMAGYDPRSPLSLAGDFAWSPEGRPRGRVWRIAWLGDLGGHLPTEQGVLDICEKALARAGQGPFRVESFALDFDYEALWRGFVTLRHATGGAALKVLYDDPAKRALMKPETCWEIEGSLGLTIDRIHAASMMRTSWYNAVIALFDRYDLLVLPTAQVFAFDAETYWPGEIAGRRMDSYHRWMEVASYATLAGCPTATVPAGFDESGRAMGLQLIGRPRADAEVLSAAADYEEVCEVTGGR